MGGVFRSVAALLVAAGLALLVFALPSEARGASLPSGFQDTVAFEGLNQPTAVRFSPDGRVFVAEKSGEILAYDSLSDPTPTVFADLRTEVFNNYDRGLLGLALDPQFPKRPYVYVLYAYDHQLGESAPAPKWGLPDEESEECPEPPGADTNGCVISGRLSRLTAAGDEATEEKPLVEGWCQQFSSHSIGDLQFDSSGALYASGGDGASFGFPDYGQAGEPLNPCGDPPTGVGGAQTPPTAEGGALRAQDVRTPTDPTDLNGSVIRVDPETGEGLPGNPMYESSDPNARRIVAYGFRNPFRFAIDPASHEVYVDNVGWETYEEIDRFNPTANTPYNSGWPCYEGPEPQPAYEGLGLNLCQSLYESPGAASPPFFYYAHEHGLSADDKCPNSGAEGTAISGSTFYTGNSFPSSYDGALFFADAVRGCIWAMFPGADGRPDPSTLTTFMVGNGQLYPGVDLQVGPDGALYYVDLYGEEYGPGSIHRIQYFSGNQPPVAHLSVDHQWGKELSLEVHFNAGGSTDADGDPLTYEWDLNGDGNFDPPTSTSTATETYEDTENHTAEVRVTDSHGASSIDRVTIYPGDTPPEPEVIEPSSSLEWSVGEQIDFKGAATDEEDGTLPSTSLDWSARLLHCPSSGCHAHPLQAFPAVDSGSFAVPDHDYPSHIELTLTATDSRGLSATKTVRIDPQAVDLAIASNPPGLSLTAGSEAEATPFTLTAIKDSHILLSAPLTEQLGGKTYTWTGWSDNGDRVHTIVAESPATYEASYSTPETPTGSIAGTVTDASTKAGVKGIDVCAYEIGEEFEECESTNASGEYTVSGLPSGSYKVEFSPSSTSAGNYITQYYDGKSSLAAADSIPVTAPATTSGIDAKLMEPPSVEPVGIEVPKLSEVPPIVPPPKKPLKCRKGFKKWRVHGRARCIKVKHHHKLRRGRYALARIEQGSQFSDARP